MDRRRCLSRARKPCGRPARNRRRRDGRTVAQTRAARTGTTRRCDPGCPLEGARMFRRLAALPAAALALALTAIPALAAPFPSRIDLPDGWQPEGITAGRGTTAYVGSLATG